MLPCSRCNQPRIDVPNGEQASHSLSALQLKTLFVGAGTLIMSEVTITFLYKFYLKDFNNWTPYYVHSPIGSFTAGILCASTYYLYQKCMLNRHH